MPLPGRRLATLLGVLAIAGSAAAGPAPTKADRANAARRVADGKKLMAKKEWAEACAKFQEAKALADSTATTLALAQCNEKGGHPAAAYALYKEVVGRAHAEHNAALGKRGQAGMASAEKKVAWVIVAVPAAGNLGDVSLDGGHVTSFGTPMPVDPGSHIVAANGPSRSPWSTTVSVGAGDTESVTVPVGSGEGASSETASSSKEKEKENEKEKEREKEKEEASSSSDAAAGTAATSSGSASDGEGHASQHAADKPKEAEPEEEEPRHTGVTVGIQQLVTLYNEVTDPTNNARSSGTSLTTVATLGYDANESLRAWLSMGFTHNAPPTAPAGFSISNAEFGARYLFYPNLSPLRRVYVGPTVGLDLPIGTGGGDAPDAGVFFANSRARALYPLLFDPAYFGLWIGALANLGVGPIDFATDVSVTQSIRVQGSKTNVDAGKTRLIFGERVGARFGEHVEPYVDIRYFRYLSSPSFVSQDPTTADNLYGGIGVALVFRPLHAGLGYERALDPPLVRDGVSILMAQLSLDF